MCRYGIRIFILLYAVFSALFAAALDNTSLVFTTSGSEDWYGTKGLGEDGVDCAASLHKGDSSSADLMTEVSDMGTIAFKWKVSSESSCDKLTFLVDGVTVAEISGTGSDWSSYEHSISTAGAHTLTWRYEKDYSLFRGGDCAWIDQVVWTSNAPPASVVIDPLSGTVEVVADSPDAALAATTLCVPTEAQSLIDAGMISVEAYQSHFTKTATLKSSGVYAVTASIADSVKSGVAESAMVQIADCAGNAEMAIAVKPGLCYGFASAPSPDGFGTITTAFQSDTVIKVTKGADHRFVKIVISALPCTR